MYVRGVQTARSVLLFYLGLLALIGLIMAGIVIFHVGLFYCLPWSLKARAVLLMILGGIYFVVPLLVLFFWSRDQFWMKATGADEIVENALKKKTSRKDK
jgi:cytochrome b subunit of formate dehydrogenase